MIVIAIDGPAASGKSSVSRRLAKRLGFAYVNSGSLYRAVTWEALRQGADTSSLEAIEGALANARFACTVTDRGESAVSINGEIADAALRDIGINSHVSKVAAVPAVRTLVTNELRALAAGRPLVMEGRDIGSAVFPETPHKFYLDATPEIRNQRRAAEGLTDQIEARDRMDSTRKTAPLTIAPGARIVDTSYLTLDGVVDAILDLLRADGIHEKA